MDDEAKRVLLERALKDAYTLGVIIEPKESKWYWSFVGKLLYLITFGKVDFMKSTYTTFGTRIGTPPSWEGQSVSVKYAILMHELTHVRQFYRYGFGNVWLGFALTAIAYLLLPLPTVFAYCRARLELEAMQEELRALKRVGVDLSWYRSTMIHQFTSVNYLWMWPFRGMVERWIDSAITKVLHEE